MQFRVLPPEGRADPRFPQGPRGPHPRPPGRWLFARGPTSPRRSLNQPGVKGEGALRSAAEPCKRGVVVSPLGVRLPREVPSCLGSEPPPPSAEPLSPPSSLGWGECPCRV